MPAPIAAAEDDASRAAWTRESADAAIADPAKRAEMEFIRKAVMQGARCAPPALACSPMLTPTLACSPMLPPALASFPHAPGCSPMPMGSPFIMWRSL